MVAVGIVTNPRVGYKNVPVKEKLGDDNLKIVRGDAFQVRGKLPREVYRHSVPPALPTILYESPGSEAIRLPFTGRIEAPYVMTVVYQHLLVVFCPPGYAIGAHHRYVLVFVPKRKVYSLGNTPRFACGYFAA